MSVGQINHIEPRLRAIKLKVDKLLKESGQNEITLDIWMSDTGRNVLGHWYRVINIKQGTCKFIKVK